MAAECSTPSADSDYSNSWIGWFLASRDGTLFCDVDEEYINDRFNLTGLNLEVKHYSWAIEWITDIFAHDIDEEMREQIEQNARHLYGLIHARYIITSRGLAKMVEKYRKYEFGRCPRVNCRAHPVLPISTSDVPRVTTIKLYCPSCEDTYLPKSSRHSAVDGAYFGTTFAHLLLLTLPQYIPHKSEEIYVPRLFGFKLHSTSKLIRWRVKQREEMKERVRQYAKTLEEEERERKFIIDGHQQGRGQQAIK